MEAFTIRVTAQAREYLERIRDYIAKELCELQIEKQMLELLRKEIQQLSFMPYRVQKIDEQPWGEMGFRKIRVKNYYIYFWLDENAKIIQVIAVIYVRRDPRGQLGTIDFKDEEE